LNSRVTIDIEHSDELIAFSKQSSFPDEIDYIIHAGLLHLLPIWSKIYLSIAFIVSPEFRKVSPSHRLNKSGGTVNKATNENSRIQKQNGSSTEHVHNGSMDGKQSCYVHITFTAIGTRGGDVRDVEVSLEDCVDGSCIGPPKRNSFIVPDHIRHLNTYHTFLQYILARVEGTVGGTSFPLSPDSYNRVIRADNNDSGSVKTTRFGDGGGGAMNGGDGNGIGEVGYEVPRQMVTELGEGHANCGSELINIENQIPSVLLSSPRTSLLPTARNSNANVGRPNMGEGAGAQGPAVHELVLDVKVPFKFIPPVPAAAAPRHRAVKREQGSPNPNPNPNPR